jgi:hypothetical protein
MHLNTAMSEKGNQIQHGTRGKNMKIWEKYTIFLSPIKFLQVFLSQERKKVDQGGKYYIVSPQAHIQEAV